MTSSVQDRWHARLYFLRPLLRLSIAFIWIFTGIVSLVTAQSHGFDLLTQAGISKSLQPSLLYGASAIDLLLGFFTLINYRIQLVGGLQCFFIVAFTLTISCGLPSYWLHPFAPVAKNIPLLVATLAMMALDKQR